ncbi:MAG: saccharopine dehydrogenase C-terminal domain-containing protein [Acidimicrobiales bacterium]|jgi:saccharopine dehydrogenase-like NADP-dependent oxidoreductase
MKILLVGTGGVGEAIAILAKDRAWLEYMVLADYNLTRAKEVQHKVAGGRRFPVESVDASVKSQIVALAREYDVDLIMNAVDPIFNEQIFDAAFELSLTYMDMAMDSDCGVNLGRYQFERSANWAERGLLALVGMGVEPGISDVFAAYAAKHLFDSIEEIGVRDGANLEVEGYEFAPNFSIWTTIEECLDPPVVYEKSRGWFTTETFSEPEIFDFPDGIGPLECVNVEHEEVMLIPRWLNCDRVTFKYGLGRRFIEVLRTLHKLGLDSTKKIHVKGATVAPRDVVAACLPDPAHLGERMTGKTCAGTWVKGRKDGRPRQVYLYQVANNATTMRDYGVQAVVWQTAVGPVIALELLAEGLWKGAGVLGPEAFDPDPFMSRMETYGAPYSVRESILD